jgi:hypothetical protein
LEDVAQLEKPKKARMASLAASGVDVVLYAAYGIRDTSLRRNRIIDNIKIEAAVVEGLEKSLSGAGNKSERKAIAADLELSKRKTGELEATLEGFDAALKKQFD